jgi:hypothetical protein
MSRRLKKACYYCGIKATSLEHAPPRQFFKGFPCDSITVPSCDKHNTEKSGNDQAIVNAFLIALRNGSERWPLEPEIKDAISRALPSFELTKRKAVDMPLITDPPVCIADFPNVSHIAPSASIRSWVRQLTAALVYKAANEYKASMVWDTVIAWSPNLVESDEASPMQFSQVVSVLTKKEETKESLDSLKWVNGWSAHPRSYPPFIYTFDIHIASGEVIFRHWFYKRFLWYVWFNAGPNIIAKLLERVSRGRV